MYLIVGATPDSRWQSLLSLLEHLGFSAPDPAQIERWQATISGAIAYSAPGNESYESRYLQARQLASAELLASCQIPAILDMTAHGGSLEHWLEMSTESRLLLCYSRPEPAMYQAMVRRQAPADAVAAWQTATQGLLQVLRRHRQRVLVVNVEHAVAAPNVFLQILGQFLGRNDIQPWRGEIESSFPPTDDFLTLVAAQVVAQTSSVADLLNELEANAPPIGGVSMSPLVDCTKVWQDHESLNTLLHEATVENKDLLIQLRQAQEEMAAKAQAQGEKLDGQRKQFEELTSENELLMAQLHQVQEELESQFLEAQAQKKYLEQLKQVTEDDRRGRQRVERELEKSKAAQAALEAERQTLQKQLKQVTEDERRARQRVEREQDALLSSLSWRITTPLRWLLRPIMGAPFQKRRSN